MTKILEKRLEHGLTQREVAKVVGVSVNSYQLWEHGLTQPSSENWEKLNQILHLRE